MGCQTKIAKKIRGKKGDYVLALNQETLYEDVKLYLGDADFWSKCAYHRTRAAGLKCVNIGRQTT